LSRTAFIVRHPRRTLAALVTLVAAVGVAVGSGANFSASSANPSNTFSAGTLKIGNSQSSAILNASGLKPGQSATGTVDIKNTGSIDGDFSLSESNVTNSDAVHPLADQLQLDVVDTTTSAPVYSGSLSGLPTKALGTYHGGDQHTYQFTVTLPSSSGNDYQGGSTSVDFNWSAPQS
jgi:hypothetical protein